MLSRTFSVALLVVGCSVAALSGAYLMTRPAPPGHTSLPRWTWLPSNESPDGPARSARDRAGTPASPPGARTGPGTSGPGAAGPGDGAIGPGTDGGPAQIGGGTPGTAPDRPAGSPLPPIVLMPPSWAGAPAGGAAQGSQGGGQYAPPGGGTPSWGPLTPGAGSAAPAEGATGAGTAAVPAAPARDYETLQLPAGTVLEVVINADVVSDKAKVEQKVDGKLLSDVRLGERVVLPEGSAIRGFVAQADPGGGVKGRARIAVVFDSVIQLDGTRASIHAKTVSREGASTGKGTAAKSTVGAIGGAITGLVLGGTKDAAVGGAVGAAAGATAGANAPKPAAILSHDERVKVELISPAALKVPKPTPPSP